MHMKRFLDKMLSSVMYKKRLITLTLCVIAILKTKKLLLSEISRTIKLPINIDF